MPTAHSALAQAVQAAPILESVSADLKRNIWTFSMPAHCPVSAGRFALVSYDVAAEALQAEVSAFDPFALHGDIERFDEADEISYIAANGSDKFSRRRFCPESWRDSSVPWHASHWRLYCSRTDATGRKWDLQYGSIVHVIDDFGTLVPLGDVS